MRLARVAAALVSLAAAASPAQAQLLGFDDIPNAGGTVYVPEFYHGFTFGGGNGSGMAQCGFAGQCNWVTNLGTWASSFPAAVSGTTLAWSNGGVALTLARATPFTFTSAYVGAANGGCPGPTTVSITGSLAGSTVFSTNRSLTCGGFALETFNWSNIDLVSFASTSPVSNFLVDDLLVDPRVSAVPEPATVALLGGGLALLGLVARRRRA